MPVWVWILIAVGVVLVATVAVVTRWLVARRRTTALLRRRFGPEYDATLRRHQSRAEAEAELSERLRRREQLQIRPLDAETRERFREAWNEAQAQFVEAPEAAAANAHSLVRSVMAARGYPVENLEQRLADISVDHPIVVENYRLAQTTAAKAARGEASTEELRQAMHHYRVLFDELLETPTDTPMAHETTARDSRTQEEVTR
jgi:hypothetical protein